VTVLKDLPGRPGPIRRFGAVTAAAAAGVLLLAGCAAGQQVQTIGQRPPIDGASASAGNIEVRAAGVLGPNTGSSYSKGGSALLQLVLINTGASNDTLTSVSSPVAGSTQVNNTGVPQASGSATPLSSPSAAGGSSSPAGTGSASSSPSSSAASSSAASGSTASGGTPANQPIALPAGQSVQVGFSAVGPNISLDGLTTALYPAQSVPVTFTFGSGASVTVTMSVKLASEAPSAPVISEATQPAE
jgi:copper(I)-binding protein